MVVDRIAPLIAKLESGVDLTPEDVRRASTLQLLDVVKSGIDLVNEHARLDGVRITDLESETI